MNDSTCLIISQLPAAREVAHSNEIYLSNPEVEAPRRTLTLYYYSANAHELIIYFPICKVIWCVIRKMAFTKVHITRSDDEWSKNNKTVQRRCAGNIEYCGGAAVSREAPACLRVRITGNVSSDIDEIDGREKLAWRCFARSEEDAARRVRKAKKKPSRFRVRFPGLPRRKQRFTPSSCDLDRRTWSTYWSTREHELVAINYYSTDDFARARGQSRPNTRRREERKRLRYLPD